MEKKIALLIAGEYREFETACKTWPFFAWSDVDLYFSTWTTTNEVNHLLGIEIHEEVSVDRVKLNTQNLARVCVEPQEAFSNLSPQYKMLHRMKRGISAIQFSDVEYEAIIIIRPDLIVDCDGEQLRKALDSLKENSVYVVNMFGQVIMDSNSLMDLDNGGGLPGLSVNDVLFVGKPESIFRMSGFEWSKTENNKGHHMFYELFSKAGLAIRSINELVPIEYVVARSNTRGITDFAAVKHLSKVWYQHKLAYLRQMRESADKYLKQ